MPTSRKRADVGIRPYDMKRGAVEVRRMCN